MSYHPACYDLAKQFFQSSVKEETIKALAQHIQDEIELWLEGRIKDVEAELKRRCQ